MPTDIEWTRGADGSKGETWNPTVGCSRVSPGCDNCYAIGVVHRALQPAHRGLTLVPDGERPDWTGEVRQLPDRIDKPLEWKRPRRVFVNSLSDLFDAAVDEAFIGAVFETMRACPQHTFQILTKRPQRMAALLHAGVGGDPLPNAWLGVSIETDRYVFRADYLRQTPAAVRFLSLEPLLGPLPSLDLTGIDWVIVGGESGPGARPMHPEWVRDIRDRCAAAGVPFFFKQWGAWGPEAPMVDGVYQFGKGYAMADDGTLYNQHDLGYPDGPRRGEALRAGHDRARLTGMYRLGKGKTGRDLDGRTWDEFPHG